MLRSRNFRLAKNRNRRGDGTFLSFDSANEHGFASAEDLEMESNRQHIRWKISLFFSALGLCSANSFAVETTQEHVHSMAHHVMPFDVSKTLHIFKVTESGSVQTVVSKDAGATDQIRPIQMHLQHEAANFQRGDYSDPAMLHGAEMAGLKELQAGASHIKVSYAPIPTGGQITFETSSLHLLTALHRWFGAQLSEHGSDATTE